MTQQLLPCVEINPSTAPDACVIWLHGLGDSGHGFAPIVPELKLPDSMAVKFLFPHAPERPITINGGMRMRAWYDIKSLDFESRADLEGVKESAEQVEQLIKAQIESGIKAERIVLAGFSQGGVIALHLAPRFSQKLAGVMALSTYMCEPALLSSEALDVNRETPIMMAHGEQDEVVPVFMGNAAFKTLNECGFKATWQTYTMQHNVCMQELNDISAWLQKLLN
ncbi:carboxylesterase [Alteromonas mediterranea]|jgi:phospholipase/carboxylesterase|uniref:Carboxylesterase n=3 Tax=Alteromonas mediterranea TaxID=314275 RepID=A0AAC9NP90_9ALTE|nr:dienelactone hydrolase family protein [Alteromonas mediterranea]AGP76559.1 putative phospholipase/carboxylesterase family protein [Alteromonas mediterranea 615]MBR9784699.1 alpha/beta fold hydrolase [Gammaproteobacteria bacterium]MEA3379371.1 dienelactone hydrolase family protein [Pseudomonadota bacterium]APD88440.1 carboxylesterase [Alteromonas mediterranea]APD92625.1 carboxylesterase [Alteromonas mediterranea]|tara:strand:- start:771 stop:1442 length:672 start_codon:yes stop_codon:yes gene_type:complete